MNAKGTPLAEGPVLAIPQVDVGPVIDGRIDTGEWDGAAVTCGFSNIHNGYPVRGEVIVSVCYDAENLYFLFECFGEAAGKLRGGLDDRGLSLLWDGSKVELFLAPEAWPVNRYAHFIVNHAGASFDAMYSFKVVMDFDESWNSQWKHTTGESAGKWVAELAIPWRSLAIEKPVAGSVLRGNFCRNAPWFQEMSSWVPLRNTFFQPERFGQLVLAGKAGVAAVTDLSGRQSGKAEVEARLIGPAHESVLNVTVTTAGPEKAPSHCTPFNQSGEGELRATAAFELPEDASTLEVSVSDADGRVLWRQAALGLADYFTHLRAEEQRKRPRANTRLLTNTGEERSWQFVNGPWEPNYHGHLIVPAEHVWSAETYMAFNTERAYRDCVVSGKFRFVYAGGAEPELIVRATDSRRFYAIRFSGVMASIWKASDDGYRRMVGYRRKVGVVDGHKDPHKWYEVRVECLGPEIIVFFEDNFVCAIRDEAYPTGVVGVGCTVGKVVWKDLTVEGEPVKLKPPWSMVEAEMPRQFLVDSTDDPLRFHTACATLLPEDEILVWCGNTQFGTELKVTRSRDYGLSWDKAVEGRGGYYLKSLDELWCIAHQLNPDVTVSDAGRNFDDWNPDTMWISLSRSKDRRKTWSEPERLNVPFPSGRVYAPIKGKAGSVLVTYTPTLLELSDGSVGMTAFWRNNPDGAVHADQVQFLRTTDAGKTWSINPVDPTEWSRNESSWVELANGELVCVMRSNHESSLSLSRSRDKGKSWSKAQPIISFFGSSYPSMIRTRDNILVLATRGWGLFTSVDDGQTWSLPTAIGGYHGSGIRANLIEVSDGRILVLGDDNRTTIKGQFITVDREGVIHPALPGPVRRVPLKKG